MYLNEIEGKFVVYWHYFNNCYNLDFFVEDENKKNKTKKRLRLNVDEKKKIR